MAETCLITNTEALLLKYFQDTYVPGCMSINGISTHSQHSPSYSNKSCYPILKVRTHNVEFSYVGVL